MWVVRWAVASNPNIVLTGIKSKQFEDVMQPSKGDVYR